MHCVCCDKMLTDFESTRFDPKTRDYLDMCNKCYAASELPELIFVSEREDLITIEEMEDE